MIRKIALTVALCSGLTMTAVAGDAPVSGDTAAAPSPRLLTEKMSAQAFQTQLRHIAAGRGYLVTSDFSQSGSGHWIASALKDGKATTLGVKMPPRDLPALIN